jgi:uncharacterized protein
VEEDAMGAATRIIAGVLITPVLLVAGCSERPKETASGKARLLSVSAQGRYVGVPDATRFSITVRKVEDTAEAALKASAATMAGIIAKLKEAGVADKDLQSRTASVGPNSVCRPAPRPIVHGQTQICEPKGFKAAHSLAVFVRDMAKAGNLMGLAVASGGEEMSANEAFFADPDAMHAAARANAIENAQAKARLYAEKLGLKLGPVVFVTDDPLLLPGLHRESTPPDGQFDMGGAGADIPVEPGKRILTRTLYVTWELR